MTNQKGFAPIVVILIGVVILGAVGYVLTSNKTGGNPLSQLKIGNIALNANCDLKDPDLCKYINRVMTGDYFKNGMVMSTVTTDKDGKKSESVFELDGKQNSKITSSQDGKETMSLVNLGKATYTKDYTDGKWWKYENKTEEETETSTKKPEDLKEEMKKYTEEYKDKTSYKKIGKESCGSLLCFKYQMILTDMQDYVQYIYFDDREYLMRKTRTESSAITTETSYEYRSVSITEPSPVKEGNPYSNILNQEGTGINKETLEQMQENIKEQLPKEEGTQEEQTTETSE